MQSSDAASEITNPFSTFGEQVKKGVSLLDRIGEALHEIVAYVGGIADHVSAIATSACEQSTSLEEINVAMNLLDQVTQKNVAMFEETTAASHTMKNEANTLVEVTSRFRASRDAVRDVTPKASTFLETRSPAPSSASPSTV